MLALTSCFFLAEVGFCRTKGFKGAKEAPEGSAIKSLDFTISVEIQWDFSN
jgi:hypothetical protein